MGHVLPLNKAGKGYQGRYISRWEKFIAGIDS
jgi:hypothetical protein